MLRSLLVGRPESWDSPPDVEGGWRPRDAVGHLITAEPDDWIVRMKHYLFASPRAHTLSTGR